MRRWYSVDTLDNRVEWLSRKEAAKAHDDNTIIQEVNQPGEVTLSYMSCMYNCMDYASCREI